MSVQETDYGSLKISNHLKKKTKDKGNKYQTLYNILLDIFRYNKKRILLKRGVLEYSNLAIADIVEENSQKIINSFIESGISTNEIQEELKRAVEDYVQEIIEEDNKQTLISYDTKNSIRESKVYKDNVNKFIKIFKTQIVKSIKSYLDNFKSSDILIKKLKDIILDLYDKEGEKVEDIAKRYDELEQRRRDEERNATTNKQKEHAKAKSQLQKEQENALIEELRGNLKQHENKNIKKISYENTSMVKAYIEQFKHNSKLHTKNTNIIRDIFIFKLKKRMTNIVNFSMNVYHSTVSVIQKCLFVFKIVKAIYNGYASDVRNFINHSKKDAVKSIIGRSFRTFGLGLILSANILSVAINGMFFIGSKILKFGFGFIKIVGKTVANIFFGAINLVKNGFNLITKGLFGIFHHLAHNTFIRRFLKFITTDVGAAFLGTLSAIVEHIITCFIKKHGSKNIISEKLTDIQYDFSFDSFLNDNGLIADSIALFTKTYGGILSFLNENQVTWDNFLQVIWETIKKRYHGIIKFAENAIEISKMAFNHKYTILGMRFGAKSKNPYVMIGLTVAGLIIDGIFGRSDKKSITEENKKIDLKINLEPFTSSNANDPNFFLEHIRNVYKSKQMQDEASNKFLNLIENIESEEENIESLDNKIDILKDGGQLKNLTQKSAFAIFELTRMSNIMGKYETVPGSEKISFNMFYKALKETPTGAYQYIKTLINMRKLRVKEIKNRLENYAESKEKDPLKFIKTVQEDSKLNKIFSGFDKETVLYNNHRYGANKIKASYSNIFESMLNGIRLSTENIHIRQHKEARQRIASLTEKSGNIHKDVFTGEEIILKNANEAKFNDDNKRKIKEFETIALGIAKEYYSGGEHGTQISQYLQDTLREIHTNFLTGDDTTYKLIDKAISGTDLKSKMENTVIMVEQMVEQWRTEYNAQHKDNKIGESDLRLLLHDIDKNVVTVTPEFMDKVKKEIDEVFSKQ